MALAHAAVKVGQPAPDFQLIGSDGKTHKLSDYADKTVVLEWTNHDCPYVRKHYRSGNMQKLQKQYTDKGVMWLSVISSAPGKQGYVSADEANKLTTSRDAAPTQVLLDPKGEVGRAYGARTTPHMYVIEKGVMRYMGGIDSIASASTSDIEEAEPYVELALNSMLEGKPLAKAVTRPYGCSVKY
ncbi:thioredoxin family protein [Leucothrix pacifica]|uniref:Thioredoxin family protein n=2 Tax=Leucothrix pacifica TaxID=1247513 RepID=A0A317C3Y1_9GAMM|nr:thioredoxin family protein [Leucothrix pacifica]